MPNLTLKITSTAETDMAEIFAYIAQDNNVAAVKIITEFNKAFNTLLMFPNSGYIKAKYIKRDIRICIVAKHYQIVYYVQNDKLFIQRVLTGHQDLCAIL